MAVSRIALRVKVGGVVAVLLFVTLTGCSNNSNIYGNPLGHEDLPSSSPISSLTWQEQIAAGLATRPTIGPAITVASYANLNAAGKAWSDAYFKCLFSGNIPLTPDAQTQYTVHSSLPDLEKQVPIDFKLDENWTTCTENLFAENFGGVTAFRDAAGKQNAVIVLNEVLGRTEELTSNDYQTLSYGGDGKSLSFRTTYVLNEGGTPGQSSIAGILQTENGLLKYTRHL